MDSGEDRNISGDDRVEIRAGTGDLERVGADLNRAGAVFGGLGMVDRIGGGWGLYNLGVDDGLESTTDDGEQASCLVLSAAIVFFNIS